MPLKPNEVYPNARVSVGDHQGILTSAGDVMYLYDQESGVCVPIHRDYLAEHGQRVYSEQERKAQATQVEDLEAQLEAAKAARAEQEGNGS